MSIGFRKLVLGLFGIVSCRSWRTGELKGDERGVVPVRNGLNSKASVLSKGGPWLAFDIFRGVRGFFLDSFFSHTSSLLGAQFLVSS